MLSLYFILRKQSFLVGGVSERIWNSSYFLLRVVFHGLDVYLTWPWLAYSVGLSGLPSPVLPSFNEGGALFTGSGSPVLSCLVSGNTLLCRSPLCPQTLDPGPNPVLGGWWTLGCLWLTKTTSPLWPWRDWPQEVSILAQGSTLCHSTMTHLGFLFQGRDTLDFSLIQSFHVKTIFFIKNFFYWSIVDFQFCVSFSCIAKYAYTHICFFVVVFFFFKIHYPYPWKGNGNPLQYSCLENPMDGGAWCPWGLKESDTTERLHFTLIGYYKIMRIVPCAIQ